MAMQCGAERLVVDPKYGTERWAYHPEDGPQLFKTKREVNITKKMKAFFIIYPPNFVFDLPTVSTI
jgi:hypothetical protein